MIPRDLDDLAQSVCYNLELLCMASIFSPHFTHLKEFAKLCSTCKSILPAIESIPKITSNIISEELEIRIIRAGRMTRNVLRTMLIDSLEESGLYDLVQ